MITKADFQDAFKAAKGLEVASFQIEEGTLFASKVDICTAFCLNLANQGAVSFSVLRSYVYVSSWFVHFAYIYAALSIAFATRF